MYLCNPQSKKESFNSNNTFKSLLWGILVYKVGKSDVILDSALPSLYKFLSLIIIGSLFKTAHKLFTPYK